MDSASKRQLHDILQTVVEGHPQMPDGSFLTKWVTLMEVMPPEGEPMLLRITGTPDGRPMINWEASGILLESLLAKRPPFLVDD